MKSPCFSTFLLLAAGLAWPALGHATCTETVAVDGLVTTVVVTATANETCEWSEQPNEPNSAVVSVSGVVVPKLLQASSASFTAATVTISDGQYWSSEASCSTTSALSLLCSDITPNEVSIGQGSNPASTFRSCIAVTDNGVSSAIATCIFQAIGI